MSEQTDNGPGAYARAGVDIDAATDAVGRMKAHTADGALEIVDYKSGRLGMTEEDVKGALAMSIYQLLVKRTHPDRRVFATIHALRGGVTASASFDDN